MEPVKSNLDTKVESDAELPTSYGNFRIRVCVDPKDGKEHAILYTGEFNSENTPLVRIHSECLTGDAFGSLRCDCGNQLELAMQEIQLNGCGAILYLRQEGRGIGLHSKIQAYHLQDEGLDTVDANLALGHPADDRSYSFASNMLNLMGIDNIKLMTNNPLKVSALERNGINIIERVSIIVGISDQNKSYMSTKAERMGHHLEV